MKSCPTCGMTAEDRASFCPCCGTSFVVPVKPDETKTTPVIQDATIPKKMAVKTAPPPFFEEEKKKGGHALPIAIIAVLLAATVTLAVLWLSGGLAAMLGKDNGNASADGDTKPTLSLRPIAATAATYDGKEITTQQYLAYLYLEFENVYYNQGLYQLESTGQNPWEKTFPYGQDGEQMLLSDYIIRATQDNIKLQIVLQQMMQEYGIHWITEDEAEINKQLSYLEQDAYIDYGFDNDTYAYVLKNTNLNARSAFYGLYKVGGARAVSELDLRQYFYQNYVSYKIISIPLTDKNGVALNENSAEYQQIMAKMSDYLTTCQQHGFNVAYVQHTGNSAEFARVDADVTYMDEALAQAVDALRYGEPTLVEYTDQNAIPTIALIERLETTDVFEDAIENILYELRYEAFNQEVEDAMALLDITFDQQVIDHYQPKQFLDIINEQ